MKGPTSPRSHMQAWRPSWRRLRGLSNARRSGARDAQQQCAYPCKTQRSCRTPVSSKGRRVIHGSIAMRRLRTSTAPWPARPVAQVGLEGLSPGDKVAVTRGASALTPIVGSIYPLGRCSRQSGSAWQVGGRAAWRGVLLVLDQGQRRSHHIHSRAHQRPSQAAT
jgi:hypothetical protein